MAIAEVAGNPVMAKLVHILYEMITEVELTFYWPVVDPWKAAWDVMLTIRPRLGSGSWGD